MLDALIQSQGPRLFSLAAGYVEAGGKRRIYIRKLC